MDSPQLYLAGPMSWIPQFNFPAFHDAAACLRAQGIRIISPAELDAQHGLADAAMASVDGNPKDLSESWGDVLARDVRLIHNHCDGIVFLPGWKQSRGARLEAFVSLLCGHAIYGVYYPANGLVAWENAHYVREALRESLQ